MARVASTFAFWHLYPAKNQLFLNISKSLIENTQNNDIFGAFRALIYQFSSSINRQNLLLHQEAEL